MVETEREIMDTVRSRQKKWLGCESWSKKLESLGYPTVKGGLNGNYWF